MISRNPQIRFLTISFSHSQPLRFKVPPQVEPTKPKHKHHHHRHRHHRKRRRGKGQELEGFPPKKKLSTIFEPDEGETKAEEREDELAQRDNARINSDKDEGITFKVGAVRWKIGRQLSEEETEREKQIKAQERDRKDDDESSSSSSSDEDSSTGDELEKGILDTVEEEPSSEGAHTDSHKKGKSKSDQASDNQPESVPLLDMNGSSDNTNDENLVYNSAL